MGQDWDHLGQPLAYHWDGASWTQIATPSQAHPIADFSGVAALAADDVYGFGYSEEESGAGAPFVLHWDGTTWTTVHGVAGEMSAMSVLSPTDAWGVGRSAEGTAIVGHWDGTTWQRVSAPRLKGEWLVDVSAISTDDVWAYGESHSGKQHPFLEHWDGSRWSIVDDDAAASLPGASLRGVVALSPTDAWAVGSWTQVQGGTQFWRRVILHWDGSAWTR